MELVVILAILVVFVIAYVGWYNSEEQRTKRALRAASLVAIRDAPEGQLIKVQGRVVLEGKALLAPLSRRRCALWEVVVEERRSSGKHSHWVKVIQERRGRPFQLHDGAERALVEADDSCQLALTADARFSSGTFDDAEPHITSWIEKRGRQTTNWLGFNKSMRYHEAIIEPEETVVVMGIGRRENDPDPMAVTGYRSKAQRLVIEAPHDGPLLLSDDRTMIAASRPAPSMRKKNKRYRPIADSSEPSSADDARADDTSSGDASTGESKNASRARRRSSQR